MTIDNTVNIMLIGVGEPNDRLKKFLNRRFPNKSLNFFRRPAPSSAESHQLNCRQWKIGAVICDGSRGEFRLAIDDVPHFRPYSDGTISQIADIPEDEPVQPIKTEPRPVRTPKPKQVFAEPINRFPISNPNRNAYSYRPQTIVYTDSKMIEVFGKLKEVLVTALAVDEDEVKPEARLSEDLGAESIDYLDITFQLEKTFNIKIPKGELLPDTLFTNPEFVQNGKVTPEGITELKLRMPFADLSHFEADPEVNKFRDVFTADTLLRYIMTKL